LKEKIFHFESVGALIVFISIPLAYPQQEKEAILKRQAQADVAVPLRRIGWGKSVAIPPTNYCGG